MKTELNTPTPLANAIPAAAPSPDASDWRPCCFSAGGVLLLTLTTACNQGCRHCMRDAGLARTSTADLEALRAGLDRALGTGAVGRVIERVVISGGEPTLVRNLGDVISLVRSTGLAVVLCSNAISIDRARAAELAAAGLQSAVIGVEGIGPDYDRFRGSPAGFSRMLAGVRALDACGVAVALNITLHDGILDEAAAFAGLARSLPWTRVSVTSPILQGRFREGADSCGRLNMTEVLAFAAELRRHCAVPVDVRIPRCDRDTCFSGRSVFSMDAAGSIAPCPDEGAVNAVDLDSASFVQIAKEPARWPVRH